MTDGLIFDEHLKTGERTGTHSSAADDRWVFTEDNPSRELTVAAHMAAASRVLKGFNDDLSKQCLDVAEAIYSHDYKTSERVTNAKMHAAIELFLTTGEEQYRKYLLDNEAAVIKGIQNLGWLIGRALPKINNAEFTASVKNSTRSLSEDIIKQSAETPFGVPYRPRIWGAGWDIQSFGVRQYFLHAAFPDLFLLLRYLML